jgi:hypothetical protein
MSLEMLTPEPRGIENETPADKFHQTPRSKRPVVLDERKDAPNIKVVDSAYRNHRQMLIDTAAKRLGEKAVGMSFYFADKFEWERDPSQFTECGYDVVPPEKGKDCIEDRGSVLLWKDAKARQAYLDEAAERSMAPLHDAQSFFEDQLYTARDKDGNVLKLQVAR